MEGGGEGCWGSGGGGGVVVKQRLVSSGWRGVSVVRSVWGGNALFPETNFCRKINKRKTVRILTWRNWTRLEMKYNFKILLSSAMRSSQKPTNFCRRLNMRKTAHILTWRNWMRLEIKYNFKTFLSSAESICRQSQTPSHRITGLGMYPQMSFSQTSSLKFSIE